MKKKQLTLIKFFSHLRRFKTQKKQQSKGIERATSFQRSYTIEMGRDKRLKIQETHCLSCGSRLVKNGHNKRLIIRDKWRGKLRFRIQRKRCPRCGEIKPDYSSFAPKFCNYHENYRRRARQHYKNGLMPIQIQKVFQVDFGVDISLSTIVNWIHEVAAPLRTLLKETPVPSSGYWGYDEIYMHVGGVKMYTIDTVDVNTRFVPVARVTDNMGREEGKLVLREGRRGDKLGIEGIIKDCTTNLGGLFKTRNFKHIKQQNCVTHVKWIISKHIKAFAGLATQSRKPVPKEWRWLLKRFYAFIDSKDEADAYIKLEIIRFTLDKLQGKNISHLYTAIKQLESWFQKLIGHQQNPFLPSTNNMSEGFHKKYIAYPAFKRKMMTAEGAQCILDYRVFGHNLERFPHYIAEVELKRDRYRLFSKESGNDPTLRGHGMYFKHHLLKLEAWYGNYQSVWGRYFAVFN